ncbi:hypothetical protein AXF42_Ash009893 [Apostasia shenzhenica]|uniref:Uncharacterized protein n=1 Tax=Apostasia shenzhenica TaxID=1088818 RepID=A0A2I0AC85_9ASPA|nr:hypothetical protein AXF42_Ash009893 [Apostasia shenzhenica]
MDNPSTTVPKTLISDDPPMGLGLSRRASHLLQNCDLPPPLKLFSPFEDPFPLNGGKASNDDSVNRGLMRTLLLSQMRARVAAERAELTGSGTCRLAEMLLDESLRLSVHRRWTMMLELEVSMLRGRISMPVEDDGGGGEEDGEAEIAWCLALALCFGVAGVGFAIGRSLF